MGRRRRLLPRDAGHHDREYRPAPPRHRSVSLTGWPGVDHGRVHARVRRPAAARRQRLRPVRGAPRLPDRHRRVRARLDRVRPGPERWPAHRVPRDPRYRGGRGRTGHPRPDHRALHRPRRTSHSGRTVGRGRRRGRGGRAAARRRAPRRNRLARRFLGQCARRRRHSDWRPPVSARPYRETGPARRGRSDAGDPGAGRVDVRDHRHRRPRPHRPCGRRVRCRGPGCSRVRVARAPQPDADAATVDLLRARILHGDGGRVRAELQLLRATARTHPVHPGHP